MTAIATTNTSVLVTKTGTEPIKKAVGTLGAYQQIMQSFVNYITAIGTPPQIPASSHVPATVTNAANNALTKLSTDFKAAQVTADGLQTQINGITDVINAANTFARHGKITMNTISDAIIQYKKDNQSVDRPDLKSQVTRMENNCTRLQTSVDGAHTSTSAAVTALQADEATLNTDFQQLQESIPAVDGKTLNLDTLTEAQAYQKLSDNVNALNSQISDLQKEINWLTFGEVSVGIVAGLIVVADFWNPIGWAVAGVAVAGEVEMVGKKAADTARLNTDLQNLALTQDEEAILHPLYAIKNAVAQLSTGVDAAEKVSTELESLKNNFADAADDLDTFLDDVTDNVSLEDLQGDVSYVLSDYAELEALCTTLLDPVASKVVPQSALANATNAPSSS